MLAWHTLLHQQARSGGVCILKHIEMMEKKYYFTFGCGIDTPHRDCYYVEVAESSRRTSYRPSSETYSDTCCCKQTRGGSMWCSTYTTRLLWRRSKGRHSKRWRRCSVSLRNGALTCHCKERGTQHRIT